MSETCSPGRGGGLPQSGDSDREEAWDAAAGSLSASADRLPRLLQRAHDAAEGTAASGSKDDHELLSSMLAWRHSCFLDVITADSQLAAVMTSRSLPASLSPERGMAVEEPSRKTGLRIATALHFVRDLLASSPPHSLPGELVRTAVDALAQSAALASSVPVCLPPSEGSRKLLEFISRLTERLRRIDDGPPGAAILVPVGWLNTATGASVGSGGGLNPKPGGGGAPAEVLLALRRAERGWDVAVCSASCGLGYHPSHGGGASSDCARLHDPVLLVRGVHSARLLDSAPWLLLYRELAFRSSASTAGARTLYEVVLPFLSERSLPASLLRDPPPREFRRRAAPLGDRTRGATAMEGLRGLLLLCGCAPTLASVVCLRLRRLLLSTCRHELRSLSGLANVSVGQHDHSLLSAGCRGLAAHAAAAAALPLEEDRNAAAAMVRGGVRAVGSGAGAGRLAGERDTAGDAEGRGAEEEGRSRGELEGQRGARSGTRDGELLAVARLVGQVGALADELHARALGTAPPELRLPVAEEQVQTKATHSLSIYIYTHIYYK